jgi:hypothetical protein
MLLSLWWLKPVNPTYSRDQDKDFGWRPPRQKVLETTLMDSLVPQFIPLLSRGSPELLASDFSKGNFMMHNMRF